MIQSGNDLRDVLAVGTHLKRQAALRRRGQHHRGIERLLGLGAAPQALEPRNGRDHRVELTVGELTQARVEVAA